MWVNFQKNGNGLLLALLTSGIVLLTCSTSSLAESGTLNLSEARRLLDEGKAEQSAALLKQDLQTFAGNAEYDYLLGLALYQSGQSGEAIFAFERVLMVNPENTEVRLKAARISIERGNVEYASELLQPLSVSQLDNTQRQEELKIRADIDKILGKRAFIMRGYLQVGVAQDDNVTGGPAQTELTFPKDVHPPLPPQKTQLGSASRDQDTVSMLEAGLSLQQAVTETTWLTADGNIHQNYNSVRADVNNGYSNLNLGVLTRNGHESFGMAILGQTYQVARITYRNSLGASLNWTHSFSDKASLSGYVQQLNFVYPDNAIDNTTRRIAGFTLQSIMSSDGALQCGGYGGQEIAQDLTKPHFSFHLWGASLGGKLAFSKDLSFFVAANYESRTHDAIDALYLTTRVDSLLTAGTSLDYKLSKTWHLMPSYSYTRNASNTELYDYTRNVYMLQLKWDFDNEK